MNLEIESDAEDKIAWLISELARVVQETNRPARKANMYDLPPPNI